jgi:hypothetical protein
MGATSPAGRRRAAINAAMSGTQEDVFLFTSYACELIIAKICHEVKMTFLSRLEQPLRAGMTIDAAATIVRARCMMSVIGAIWLSLGHYKF